jgi:hypothetical protein
LPRPHADIATRGMRVLGAVVGSGNTPELSSQNCCLTESVAYVSTLPVDWCMSFVVLIL